MDVAEPEICCGSAGIYNVVQPEPAERLGRRKADNLLVGRPEVIAAGYGGCIQQIRRHAGDADIPVVRPVELLDASCAATRVRPAELQPKAGYFIPVVAIPLTR